MVGTDLGPLAGKGGIFGATRARGLGSIEFRSRNRVNARLLYLRFWLGNGNAVWVTLY
jgi:hypothetical protein